MRGILFQYELNPTTWVYLSSLMTIGIYFKFRRFWSLRNLDLVALIGFSPGLILVFYGVQRQLVVRAKFEQQWLQLPFVDAALSWRWLEQLGAQQRLGQWLEQFGYAWLFVVGGFFLIRLLLDAIVVRRPLLEPNLSSGGLAFTGAALLVFLITNVIYPNPADRLEYVLGEQQEVVAGGTVATLSPLLAGLSEVGARSGGDAAGELRPSEWTRKAVRRGLAIAGHLAVVVGIVLVGYRHFDNIQTGMAVGALYLLLPYTAQMTGRIDHVLPAALLVWAVEAYRRPLMAGLLLGAAAGLIFCPLFLLPLWCGFYWRRGLWRFLIGVGVALAVAAVVLVLSRGGPEALGRQMQQMFGWGSGVAGALGGFWNPQDHEPVFRIPVIAAFLAMCGGLALWPAQKNLGTLLSCSAAVMLGVQFWYPQQGGLHVAWYLPLLLLTIFRPNLEDRVALSALAEGWSWRRKTAGR